MEILIKEVLSKRDLKQFIYLPEKIHREHSNWVPPIYIDEWAFFNTKKNHSFDHCDHILLLAEVNGEVVGRCMGLVHHNYNKQHNENDVRFSFIETENNQKVFHALIQKVSEWGKDKGMERIVGPLAFSDKDPQGFLIEGFNEPIAIASNCNYPYVIDLIEAEGFVKKADLVVYKIDIPKELPTIYRKIEERYHHNNSNVKIREFTRRSRVKPYIRPVLTLINETFSDIYGFTPFNEKEMHEFANRYLYLINPNFIKVAVNEKDEVIGTIIGMSDISKGIQKAKGRLIPFGFFHILTAGKKSAQLNLLLGAVDPRYQGRGLDALMGIKIINSGKKLGKKIIDSHLELETNKKVRAEMERMGGIVYKKYRIFQKVL